MMLAAEISKVLSAEKVKLRRQRTTWSIPLSVAVMTFLVFLAIAYAAARDWAGIQSGFYLASATTGWMINVTGLLAMIITCFQISGEFAMGTVKPAWVKGLSRHGWLSGKVVVAAMAVTVLFVIVLAVSLLSAGARHGFTDLMEKDFTVHTAAALWKGYILCSALTLFSLWAVVTVTSMLAACLNRTGSAIAAAVLLAVALSVAAVFGPARPFLLTSALSLPFEQMTAMSKGLPLPLEWGDLVWKTLACAGAWLAISCAASHAIIARKEITF
jgi:ABC-type transport system involved in multi-copper enzyme maturation permease subunit